MNGFVKVRYKKNYNNNARILLINNRRNGVGLINDNYKFTFLQYLFKFNISLNN